MLSKWKIKGLDTHVFGEDKKLYRLPYKYGKKHYQLREVKKQYGNRYKIKGEWLSERQIKNRLIIDPNPIELMKELEDQPF